MMMRGENDGNRGEVASLRGGRMVLMCRWFLCGCVLRECGVCVLVSCVLWCRAVGVVCAGRCMCSFCLFGAACGIVVPAYVL